MKRKVFFHGPLREKCPDGIELDADTVSEAINGACKILNLRVDLYTGKQTFKILGCDSYESIVGHNEMNELHLVPAFSGAGGVVKLIIGVVLVVVGIVTGQPELISLGASLVIGGLMSLLFPIHNADGGFSHYLGAPGNTTKIGTRIGLVLGTCAVYGQILSYNIDQLAN